jgi:DNA modification methylase
MSNEWAVQNTITKNIDDVVPYDSNPREHAPEQIEQVANSIKEFGWTMPILIDENNEIIAGHGRLLAGKSLGIKEVPCIVAKGWSDEKKKAYCIADNKLTENSTWSKDFLKLNFEFLIDNEFDLGLTGFSNEEIAKIVPDFMIEEGLTDEDEVPEIEDNPITKEGDIWILGEHRLMCGDSTKVDDINKLVLDKIDLLFTSPPYNAGKSEKLSGNTHLTDNKYQEYNDDKNQSEYLDLLNMFTSEWIKKSNFMIVNLQQLSGNKIAFIEYLNNFKNNLIDIAIWNKGHGAPAMAKNVMNSCFEYLIFLTEKNEPSRAIPCKEFRGNIKNIYDGKPNRKNEFSSIHGATFPVDLVEWVITNFSHDKSIIADSFSGVGTTLIGCQKHGRIYRGMELDSKYVDATIKRWQNFTGKDAVLESTGELFNNLK